MEIGPALPPHLAQKLNSSREENSTKNEEKESSSEARKQTEEKSDSDEEESYGPALPPGFKKNKESASSSRFIGPMRPHFDASSSSTITSNVTDNNHNDDDDDDDNIIGPTPPPNTDFDVGFERTKMDIEARSKAKRDQISGKKDTKPKRETWMTELPPDLSKNFGLGPRKFRSRAVEIGDQSVWTDTPADKARKAKKGDKGSKRSVDDEPSQSPWELARDQQMSSQVDNYNKRHRSESLMDIHTKKLEKQKEKDKGKPVERRPFDRDKDLNLPRMSDGQKKSVINKSKELGSRFQPSKSGSSFL